MNSTTKLLLTGVVALVGVFFLTKYLESEEPQNTPPVVRKTVRPTAESQRRKVPLVPAEEIPAEVKVAENYLNERWSHMGDTGAVIPRVEPDGASYYIGKDVIVGYGGNGRQLYATSVMKPHRYDGPKIKRPEARLKAAAKVELKGFTPNLARGKLGKGKKVPLEQLLGGNFGNVTESVAGAGGEGGGAPASGGETAQPPPGKQKEGAKLGGGAAGN